MGYYITWLHSYIMYRRITIVYIHDCFTTYRVTKYDNHVFTIKYNVSYHPHSISHITWLQVTPIYYSNKILYNIFLITMMITMVWNRSYHTFWYIYTSYEYSRITYHMMTNDVHISYLMRHTIQLASNIRQFNWVK